MEAPVNEEVGVFTTDIVVTVRGSIPGGVWIRLDTLHDHARRRISIHAPLQESRCADSVDAYGVVDGCCTVEANESNSSEHNVLYIPGIYK